MCYPFVMTDAGRSSSKRSRQANYCTVRAFALAYDAAYDLLAAAGRECGKGFELKQLMADLPAQYLPFPSVKGRPRMNPVLFTTAYPEGMFIVKAAKHVFVVRDGTVYDTFKSRPDRCIYSAWKVTGPLPC